MRRTLVLLELRAERRKAPPYAWPEMGVVNRGTKRAEVESALLEHDVLGLAQGSQWPSTARGGTFGSVSGSQSFMEGVHHMSRK